MSFDARHPDAGADPHTMQVRFGQARVPPEVLAKVGETFAAAMYRLQRQLAAVGAQAVAPQAMLDEVGRLEHLGVQIQQVARVLAGDGRATVETFDLAAAARQSLTEWAAAAQRRGVRLSGPVEPVPVDAAAGVVEQLLDLALDYALRIGSSVEVGAAPQGLPPRPMLSLHVQCADPHPAQDDDGFDNLHWQLFALLARAGGLAPQRVAAGRTVVLMLGFPARDGAGETEARSAALLPSTPVAAGRRVLLLEPRDLTRLQAHRLLQAAGMDVDAAASIAQARMGLPEHAPDALVTGVAMADPECTALIDALRLAQPKLRVIELVDDDSAFALSLPGANQAARVGRRALARTLVMAVAQELDSAWDAAA